MHWTPIRPNHAIERTRILIQFATPISNKVISGLGKLVDDQRPQTGLGPRFEVHSDDIAVTAGVSGPQFLSQRSVGWQFNRETEPGVVVEALILGQRSFLYETTEYVRWGLFKERYSNLTSEVIKKLATDVDVLAIALEYFDRFIFSGSLIDASPSLLINNLLCTNLPPSARSGNELWHLHRGWFEGFGENRFLINQNITAENGKKPDDTDVRSVSIYTKVEHQSNDSEIDLNAILANIDGMHVVSKRVVSETLLEDVKQKVGLV